MNRGRRHTAILGLLICALLGGLVVLWDLQHEDGDVVRLTPATSSAFFGGVAADGTSVTRSRTATPPVDGTDVATEADRPVESDAQSPPVREARARAADSSKAADRTRPEEAQGQAPSADAPAVRGKSAQTLRVRGEPEPSPSEETPSEPGTPEPSPTERTFAEEVVELTNAERADAGCDALSVDPVLTDVAQAHSEDMAAQNYFSHTGKDGRSPFDRIRDAGYEFRRAAENIAAGYRTPAAVIEAWMGSSGHRANILNCSLTEIGVGYAEGGSYGRYWTQVFATPR